MEPQSESSRPGTRLSSLDGLRGIAAFVVLVRHSFMLIPALNAESVGSTRSGVAWWLTYTPLHIVWAGPEAVVVFFVLSGFVLTRSADRRGYSWPGYYVSRLVRLYLPVLGALVLAAASIVLVPRALHGNESPWLAGQQPAHVSSAGFLHQLVLVRGPGLLDPPLWSLRWEVFFSLLLPAAVFCLPRRPRPAVACAVVALVLPLAGAQLWSAEAGRYLVFLPMFAIGALMAHNREALARVGRRLGDGIGSAVGAAAVALLLLAWLMRDQNNLVFRPAEVAGAALLVFAFGYWRRARSVGESRPLQWLGRRSFSLYLIHFPIVMAIGYALGANSRFAFLVAIPAALLASDLFYRVVERPSHRLARRVRTRGFVPGLVLNRGHVRESAPIRSG